MQRSGLALAVLALPLMTAAGAAQQARAVHLDRLSAALDLTERGVNQWLRRLVADSPDAPVERLIALALDGTVLAERRGERSQVRVDGEIRDLLLRRPTHDVVLMHNHPASAGLSGPDLRQLATPAVAAVVAIGHDRSVFLAAAGPEFDPVSFEERQYEAAVREVTARLRTEWPGIRPPPVAEAYFSHLVTLSLARAGILDYWFVVRGSGSALYADARPAFGRVVAGAAKRLKKGS
jgi:hypothetical protein